MHPSIYLQLQQIGDENDGPESRCRPARRGNSNPGFVDPALPGEGKGPYAYQKSLHASNPPTTRGQKQWSPGRPAKCRNPNLGFVESAPPWEDNVPTPDQNTSMHPQLQHTGGENGDPPGRHRPARRGNLNPGFVEPAPPGEDKVS